MMKLTQPFRGLQDFGKLQGQSNDVYDGSLANLRDVAAAGGGGFNNTMAMMHAGQSKMSPWAPFFQSLDNQHVSEVGMDAARPHGIADDPNHQEGPFGPFGAGPGGNVPTKNPLMASTNIAGPPAIAALKRYRK